MSRVRLLVWVVLAAGVAPSGPVAGFPDRSSPPTCQPPTPARPDRPAPPPGLYLTATVPPAPKAGHPLPVTVKLDNRSAGPVTLFWDTAEPFRLAVVLTDAAGKAVPLTRLGKRETGVVEPGEPILNRDGSIRSVRVHPGRPEDVSIDNLALYYDLTVAGEYVLTLRAWVGDAGGAVGDGRVESAAVRFRIRP